MDVFQLRDGLVKDYSKYIKSFISIQDDRIRQHVDQELAGGILWLVPLNQLNPNFELKPPPSLAKKKKLQPTILPDQPSLVSNFTPPLGNRSLRLKRVMDLGQPKNSAELGELAAALGDEDSNIRWLVGSSLVRLRGPAVVQTLAAFPNTNPSQPTQEESIRVLSPIAETDDDEMVRDAARAVVEEVEENN